jgi:inner membrane protein
MTAPTHIVAGISAMSFVAILVPAYKLSLTHIIVGSIAALLPDVDNPQSFIGRLLFFISHPIDRKYGHRTITHSLLATFIVGGVTYLSLYIVSRSLTQYAAITATVVIAYFSHIFFDGTTKQGVQIYYPAQLWGVFPARASWRIRTGSKPEIVFFVAFLTSALIFLPLGQSGMINTFNRLFMVKQVDIRLRELEAKLDEVSHGYTEEQIDSLLRKKAIDPKQADEMKTKRRKAELEIEKFKIDQGMDKTDKGE